MPVGAFLPRGFLLDGARPGKAYRLQLVRMALRGEPIAGLPLGDRFHLDTDGFGELPDAATELVS